MLIARKWQRQHFIYTCLKCLLYSSLHLLLSVQVSNWVAKPTSFSVLKAQSLKSESWQCHALSEASREGYSLSLSALVALGICWHSLAYRSILPSVQSLQSHSTLSCICPCIIFLFLKGHQSCYIKGLPYPIMTLS